MVMDWKTRKIKAINKLSKKKGWSSNDNNPYFYLVHEIYKTKATTPKQISKTHKTNTLKPKLPEAMLEPPWMSYTSSRFLANTISPWRCAGSPGGGSALGTITNPKKS